MTPQAPRATRPGHRHARRGHPQLPCQHSPRSPPLGPKAAKGPIDQREGGRLSTPLDEDQTTASSCRSHSLLPRHKAPHPRPQPGSPGRRATASPCLSNSWSSPYFLKAWVPLPPLFFPINSPALPFLRAGRPGSASRPGGALRRKGARSRTSAGERLREPRRPRRRAAPREAPRPAQESRPGPPAPAHAPGQTAPPPAARAGPETAPPGQRGRCPRRYLRSACAEAGPGQARRGSPGVPGGRRSVLRSIFPAQTPPASLLLSPSPDAERPPPGPGYGKRRGPTFAPRTSASRGSQLSREVARFPRGLGRARPPPSRGALPALGRASPVGAPHAPPGPIRSSPASTPISVAGLLQLGPTDPRTLGPTDPRETQAAARSPAPA